MCFFVSIVERNKPLKSRYFFACKVKETMRFDHIIFLLVLI